MMEGRPPRHGEGELGLDGTECDMGSGENPCSGKSVAAFQLVHLCPI